jgi:predicted TIM-barrel fold metal-dependent hydrolase
MALLARACPDVSIIVDHVGGPFGAGANDQNYRDAVLKWRQDIREIAKYQNVAIKMGGLGMPVFGFGWDGRDRAPDSNELAAAMAPYFLWCIESFGVNRCMFESNFPPDKISFSYTTLWNAFKRVTRDFSAAERTTLFHDSATRIYRLAY